MDELPVQAAGDIHDLTIFEQLDLSQAGVDVVLQVPGFHPDLFLFFERRPSQVPELENKSMGGSEEARQSLGSVRPLLTAAFE
ncbi:hypothetical protein [Micromonospora sp. NPDC005324]|uniref:hypothetical protein n=1 Tax=Micromonospora sp. NPDC005324 TaxID=3157033 RepID=UPI0033BC8AA1